MIKKIVLSIIILIAFVIGVFLWLKKPQTGNTPPKQVLSPHILNITAPISSLNGMVDKIDKNTLFISIWVRDGSQNSKITYKIDIDSNTQITLMPTNINYLFNTSTIAPPQNIPLSTIKPGQTVVVNTLTDLRTLSTDQFTATSIQVPSPTFIIGKIVSINNDILKVKGSFPFAPPSPTPIEYTVKITPETEISRLEAIPSKPLTIAKFTVADLKKDIRVSVYAVEDVTTTQILTALRIEPLTDPAQ